MRQRTPPWEIILFWSHVTSVFQGLSLAPWGGKERTLGTRLTMTQCDGPPSPLVISLRSTRLNLQFFPAAFSIRLFACSDTRLHSFLLARSTSPYKILNGLAKAGFDPLYCSFGTLRLCWLRYEKEPRSSPSPWYRRQGYYLLFHLSDRRPVSKISLVSFISHLLRQVGIDPFHYSGHSFRIGGATSASLAGLTDYEIKLLGRWNSDFYQQYTRSPFSCCSIYPARLHKRTRWSFSTPLLTSSMNLLQITN